ncbi:MAG: hypothetical protein HYT07_03175 [Candidatus Levybacteria bacterium]|nr:hypothetical protein [Candidatus Levybacteria bacterium]
MITKFIDFCGGAGPLSQIRSLGSFINDVDNAYSKSTTVERTEVEIFNGLVKIEEKFAKERWSNEDKADFYNISRDILGAAPSIFSDCLGLFERLNPSQMKLFAKEIYPLYRTKLVLIEKIDDKGKKVYNRQQLLQLRTAIRGFVSLLNEGEKPLETQKQNLLVDIQNLIKDRFGIIKIPENFTPEHTRSIINISTYLANLHGRTPEKETIIGFYLSLMINDKWDSFRSGEEINPDEYLTHEKSSEIKSFLNNRQRLNPLNVDNLGIHQEQLSELIKLLQKEQQNIVIGNIETIDIKLTNIILNLHGLEDPDLHPDLLDKQRLKLLLNWGNRKIGSTVAKMYQKSLNPERSIQFSGEETIIQQDITSIIQESGLILNHQVLKEHFQDGIKPLATVVNLLGFVGETQAEPEIEQLRNLLEPSDKVIEIFRRLGEDFKPTSGAIALSQDLTYLDNLIVKREDELTLEERTLLTDYTTQIRKQVIKLESIYGQIKNKFAGLKQGLNTPKSPLLQDKLHEIDRIINTQTTQQVITSIMTNNLNTIIENIRECLSCTKEGSNNDTNLTFGDTNKFYLYSQTETQEKGSISDQVVFVEPTTRKDGSQSISFVLDRVYGTNTPTILENQVDTILKKCTTIRERFPKIKLTIFVSDAATKTGGISTDMFLERLRAKKITAEREIIEVNVVESSTGDHYIEFGGDARKSGKRDVDGILISA